MTAVVAAAAIAGSVGMLAGVWLVGPVAAWVGRREHQGRHRAPAQLEQDGGRR